jgi:hypothetical protein
MTNRNIYNSLFVLVPLFFSAFVNAQSRVTVKATVDRSEILIGEPIRLTLWTDIPASQPIRFFRVDSLPHFEFLKQEKIDTVNTGSGTALSQLIHITSFDSGHWVIPSIVLYGGMATDTIPVDVGFSPFDPEQPYHDIRDIIEVNPVNPKKGRWARLYLVIAAVMLLLTGLLFLVIRLNRKKPVVIRPASPYETAMEKLEKLLKEKNDPRQYYSRLVDIFRVYIFTRKGIHSLQKTTDGLVLQLHDLGMPKEQFDTLSQYLRLSDFVKFAKYVPVAEDDLAAFRIIKSSIENIEHMP